MGLKLPTPLVLASSALSNRVENLEMAEGHGAGAVVLRSLFEEQIEAASTALDEELSRGAESNPEARTYFPPQRVGPHEYLSLVERAKKALEIPVIASLNCCAPGELDRVRARHRAGGRGRARGEPLRGGGGPDDLRGARSRRRYLEIVHGVRGAVRIPIAVKLSPFFTSLAHFAARLDQAGANGLVLFNRFLQPDVSLEKMVAVPSMTLSAPSEALVPLRWIALLHGRVRAHLAASTGVYDAPGVLKQLLAGAQVVQLASTLVKSGIPHSARSSPASRTGSTSAGSRRWTRRGAPSRSARCRTRAPSSGRSTSTSSCPRTSDGPAPPAPGELRAGLGRPRRRRRPRPEPPHPPRASASSPAPSSRSRPSRRRSARSSSPAPPR